MARLDVGTSSWRHETLKGAMRVSHSQTLRTNFTDVSEDYTSDATNMEMMLEVAGMEVD